MSLHGVQDALNSPDLDEVSRSAVMSTFFESEKHVNYYVRTLCIFFFVSAAIR